MDKTAENKALVESYHQATNCQDLQAFDTIFASDFTNIAAGFPPMQGIEAMKRILGDLFIAFPDWHIAIEDIFGEENKVVVRWKLDATHLGAYQDIAPTGKKIQAEGIHIDHISNGRIEKRWACNNFPEVFAFLRQHQK